MARYGLRPSKGLGQNFLINEHYLEQIVVAGELEPEDLVLEIGPGLGVLTRELASAVRRVIAIEKDRHLEPVLKEVLQSHPQVELVFQDALQIDYRRLVGDKRPVKVVANLPYYITTPLITCLLESEIPWAGLVFLVQAEVAQRLLAGPGSKEYGVLSVMVGWEYEVAIVTRVPPKAFYPAPKVMSTVVKLTRRRNDPLPVDREWLGQVLRAALGQRRKTLPNALTGGLSLSKERVEAALSHLGLNKGIRGENLTPEEFMWLASLLAEEVR